MLSSEYSFLASDTLRLVESGQDYFQGLEKMIQEAKQEIHIQTYIFENDTTGQKIITLLKEAARRGVKIYILLDGFGSFSLPEELIQDLEECGINIRFFAPLFSTNFLYIGRRLHHKVIVADAKIALIGGINIADKYCGTPTEIPWLDFAVQITDEKKGQLLQKICTNIYFKKERLKKKTFDKVLVSQEENALEILQNDWLKKKNEISDAYIKSFRTAKKEIIIVGSYFLPGRRLTNALKKAAANNVKIKLILSGISDVTLSRRASYYIYSTLLKYNVEVYEWNKSVLHGKAAVIDQHWTTIGSFNLNNLSSYSSIEMNVAINSVEFSNNYLLRLNEIIAQCERITPESLNKRNSISSRILNWLSFWIARIILILVTYFPSRRFKIFY
jgi:cardiolipin synthase